MFPYWILFSIFAAGAIEHRRHGSVLGAPAPILRVAALLAAAMVGLRYEVGGDWETYIEIYNAFQYRELKDTIRFSDPGYSILNWLGHLLGFEIWFVNLLCALILTWGLVKFAQRQPNPWLACLIAVPYLLIVVAMGYTRQAAAIGFILAALAAYDRGSLARFAVLIVFATTFHKTAMIVLPLAILSSSRNRVQTALLLLVTSVMLYYTFVEASVDKLMTNYVDAEYNSQGAAIRVAMSLGPALLLLKFRERFQLGEDQKNLWINSSYAALIVLGLLLFTSSSTAVDRLALYLIPLQIFVLSRLPQAFSNGSQPNAQVTLAVITYCAVVQLVWLNYAAHAELWLPYQLYPFTE